MVFQHLETQKGEMVLSQEGPTAEKLMVHEEGEHQPGGLRRSSSEPSVSHPRATRLRSPKVFMKCERGSQYSSQNPPLHTLVQYLGTRGEELTFFSARRGPQQRVCRGSRRPSPGVLRGRGFSRRGEAPLGHGETPAPASLPKHPAARRSKRRAGRQTGEDGAGSSSLHAA